MYIIMLITALLATTPADSTLEQKCEVRQLPADSVTATFQTLDAILIAEQSYFQEHQSYVTCNVLTDSVSVDSLGHLLHTAFPASLVTAPQYHVVISFRWSEPDTTASYRELVIGIYNAAADDHMPIARLAYRPDTGRRAYELIMVGKHVDYALE